MRETRMTRHLRAWLFASAGILVFGAFPAFAADHPGDAPTRNAGSWHIVETGTIGDGATASTTLKAWRLCLDARADRALREWEVRERQASVARDKQRCTEPRPTVAGRTLSWTMHCSGPTPAARTSIRHDTTFASGDETRGETVVVRDDPRARSRERYATRMTREGACENGTRPGDMQLLHWRVDGEETLKARQRLDLDREIKERKRFIASRLGQ